ncbi:hypothetical protein RGQ29_026499 [Quercus rubra]|uniref:HMA domain-containing protein n=1 Tax=Quercus rubra TaxID=3512 RepID=A0AAN7END0_QUERU|nr:hypothetical protein RGQ29_026499 [Quercus rubra]
MSQKIVIKVQMTCDKCRTKGMKIAAKTRGVISVALEGSDKDQLAVVGEDVDSAKLTCLLGKKLCYASILSVEEMKPNEEEESNDEKPEIPNCTITTSYPPFPRLCEVLVYDPSPSSCSIM